MTTTNRIPSPLRHDNIADVQRILDGTTVATPAELQLGDVLLSRWAPGRYLTVTNVPRHFLGEVIVDYVTEDGRHGTLHMREDIPTGRLLATRPAPNILKTNGRVETSERGLYGVTVNVETTTGDGWHGSFGLPYFQVQAASEANAVALAQDVVGAERSPERTFHICAVAL